VRLPDTALRIGLATTLFVSGLKLLDVPGSDQLIVVAFAAGLVALAVAAFRVWARRPALARE
jgi:hypothetical protein